MSTIRGKHVDLPAWLLRTYEMSRPPGCPREKRSGPRRSFDGFFRVHPAPPQDKSHYMWRGFNSSCTGLGFISKHKLDVSQPLVVRPGFEVGEPVRVRVVHCTETTYGYKVGCVFDEAAAGESPA